MTESYTVNLDADPPGSQHSWEECVYGVKWRLKMGAASDVRLHDLRGCVFGRLTAVRPDTTASRAGWYCTCACGATATVATNKLRSGATKSCGCLRRRAGKDSPKYKHGHNMRAMRTKEYRSWVSMIDRCTNPNNRKYNRYGGRGITVYRGWRRDFAAFLRHIGPAPGPKFTVDRIKNNRGYVPGNVRWAVGRTQARNKSNNRIVVVGGRAATLAEWAEHAGIKQGTLWARMFRWKWDPQRAIAQPVRRRAR